MSSPGSARSIVILACVALLAIACDSPKPSVVPSALPTEGTAPATSGPTAPNNPASSAAPGDASGTSSEALITADLASGAITLAQSLEYRAWAAFFDPRLPERYDGTGANGTDESLFKDIAAALPSMSADERAVLQPYLLRPADPASAWSAPATATAAGGAVTTANVTAATRTAAVGATTAAAAAAGTTAAAPTGTPAAATGAAHVVLAAAASPSPTRCAAPRAWFPVDWSPNGDVDTGFRAWACDTDKAAAEAADNQLLAIAQKLWAPMTKAEPNGLGLPVPDARQKNNGGNGKVDIYLLDPLAQCRQRGVRCDTIRGKALASAATDAPLQCGIAGFPALACTDYIIAPRSGISSPVFAGLLAHEFFHVLQDSHNGTMPARWYTEASANWAMFHYVGDSALFGGAIRQAARTFVYDWASQFLDTEHSTIRWDTNRSNQYGAWLWPLFQDVEIGPQAIFKTWEAMDDVDSTSAFEVAIESQLSFAEHFRDFAVRNAQPDLYRYQVMSGLEPETWQTYPHLTDFPRDPRPTAGAWSVLGVGTTKKTVEIEAADADYAGFLKIDAKVHQITIDISGLTGHDHADLDVLGELPDVDEDGVVQWRREKVSGGSITFCRDLPSDRFDAMEIVVSNHADLHEPLGLEPDPNSAVKGTYLITTSTKCKVPDHFRGTFSGTNGFDTWQGTASFDRYTADPNLTSNCTAEAVDATYCYRIVGGSATWTAGGVTKQVSLAPPDGTGEIDLFISSADHPERAGTYEIGVGMSAEIYTVIKDSRRYAFDSVRAWINAIQYPRYAPDWHLSGTEGTGSGCGIDGCGTGATWTWDLTPIFDAAPS